jgi:AcrR family transcriptional regulator
VQRERLIEAMVRLCANRGYRGTSVARLVAEAGVSRATFYEHFRDRDDCFLTVYRRAAARLGEPIAIQLAAPATGDLLHDALWSFLDAVGVDLVSARLALLDALGGGPAVRAEREHLAAAASDLLARLAASTTPPLCAPATGLMGGIAGVLAVHLLRGNAISARSSGEPLLAWLRSYAAPSQGFAALQDLGSVSDRREPAAPSLTAIGRDPVVIAVSRLSRTRGYVDFTVADLIGEAGVSRRTFYRRFAGKRDAFLAAQQTCLQESAARVAAAFFAGDTWADRIWSGLEALLDYVAAEPDLAYLDIVESYAAGPEAVWRSLANRDALSLFLADGYSQRPAGARLPRLTSEAISGGVLEMLRRELLAGRPPRPRQLLPIAGIFVLAPFLGVDSALSYVRSRTLTSGGASRIHV